MGCGVSSGVWYRGWCQSGHGGGRDWGCVLCVLSGQGGRNRVTDVWVGISPCVEVISGGVVDA